MFVTRHSGSRRRLTAGAAGPLAYVADYSAGTVSVLDTGTDTVAATIPVGTKPYNIALNPSGTTAFVANSESASVSAINTGSNTVTATTNGFAYPSAIASPRL